MNKTANTFHLHSVIKQSQSRQNSQQKYLKDGLFTCKKNHQLIVQKLKNGTLFRLTHQLVKPVTIQSKDPYLAWLQQNSLYQQQSSKNHNTMGETYFYLNLQDLQKQKKSINTTLPAIQNIKIKAKQILSIFNPKTTKDKLLQRTKQSSKHSTFSVGKQNINKKNILNSLYKRDKQIIKSQQNLSSKESHSHLFHHKSKCYQHQLSRTQLFPLKDHKQSFYSNKQNLIKSQFYLNDHKKKGYQTFYQKPKQIIQPDHDLKRVRGLQKTIVKPFEVNLKRLHKESSVSCYNQVSKYFKSMKDEVLQIIQNSKSLQQSKIRNYRNMKQRQVLDKVKQKVNIHRLKQINPKIVQNDQKQTNQSYLPQFLSRSLLFSNKQQKIKPQKIKNLAKIRV